MRSFRAQRGAALIVVLSVIVFLSSLLLVFARQMQVEGIAASNDVAQAQAHAVAMGVVAGIKADLQDSLDAGSAPTVSFVEAEAGQVGEGLYWIIRTDFATSDEYTFGVVAQNSRVNLRGMGRSVLERLPGFNVDTANAIADWRDQDDEVESGGAESSYYLSRSEPYYAKNAAFESIGELLLVRDMDENVLYGEDWNRNGVLDPNENDANASDPPDNANGVIDPGLYDYVSAYAREPNVTASGQARINIDDPTNELASFLAQVLDDDRNAEVTANIFRARDEAGREDPFENTVDFKFKAGLVVVVYAQFEDLITTTNARALSRLFNAYETPAEILGLIPGLEASDGQRIADGRPETATNSLGWLVDVLDEEKAVLAAEYLTPRSYQYRADIVAVSPDGRGFVRYLVIFDTLTANGREIDEAQVTYMQDISHLGWPLDPEIREGLRQGMNADEVVEQFGSGIR